MPVLNVYMNVYVPLCIIWLLLTVHHCLGMIILVLNFQFSRCTWSLFICKIVHLMYMFIFHFMLTMDFSLSKRSQISKSFKRWFHVFRIAFGKENLCLITEEIFTCWHNYRSLSVHLHKCSYNHSHPATYLQQGNIFVCIYILHL